MAAVNCFTVHVTTTCGALALLFALHQVHLPFVFQDFFHLSIIVDDQNVAKINMFCTKDFTSEKILTSAEN